MGNDLNPSWSQDGNKLVYQSDINGNWDLFQYDLETGKIIQMTIDSANEQYPALLENKLSFTSDKTGNDNLYLMNIKSGDQSLIYKREIISKAASFTRTGYQLYCLGFDQLAKTWGIYRYEFKYNSLKFIKSLTDDSGLPKVSVDGEYILCEEFNPDNRTRELKTINWYGDTEKVITGFNLSDASWDPGGLKIIFVSDMDNRKGEIYTIWKDGSHLERLTNDTFEVKNPIVSPDGKRLAVSVLTDDGFDIFIIPFEDY